MQPRPDTVAARAVPKELLSLLDEYWAYVHNEKGGLNEFQWQLIRTWYIKRRHIVGEPVPEVIRAFQMWLLKKVGGQTYDTFSGEDSFRFNVERAVQHNIQEDRTKGKLVPKFRLGD